MATGAYIRVALSTSNDFVHFQRTRRGLYLGSSAAMSVEITKRPKKLIRSTFGVIFKRKNTVSGQMALAA